MRESRPFVGDLQRIIEYPALGYAVPQQVPAEVEAAYHRLIDADYTTRLLPTALNARR
ncbi:hypothetical protein [Actinomadura atramentaria]|uniref:hypothetical protein n=1 Tax=Actinomadura atramentaria TaxID=1990 RepID=UPI0003A91845|nr:hypothetical protein [Actinomadura atramentaria]